MRILVYFLLFDALVFTVWLFQTILVLWYKFIGCHIQVRRGANAAEIYSLAFSSTAQWLAVSSDKGTVHVFSLKVNSSIPEQEKSQSSSNSDAAITPSSSSRSFIKLKGIFFNQSISFQFLAYNLSYHLFLSMICSQNHNTNCICSQIQTSSYI